MANHAATCDRCYQISKAAVEALLKKRPDLIAAAASAAIRQLAEDFHSQDPESRLR